MRSLLSSYQWRFKKYSKCWFCLFMNGFSLCKYRPVNPDPLFETHEQNRRFKVSPWRDVPWKVYTSDKKHVTCVKDYKIRLRHCQLQTWRTFVRVQTWHVTWQHQWNSQLQRSRVTYLSLWKPRPQHNKSQPSTPIEVLLHSRPAVLKMAEGEDAQKDGDFSK